MRYSDFQHECAVSRAPDPPPPDESRQTREINALLQAQNQLWGSSILEKNVYQCHACGMLMKCNGPLKFCPFCGKGY